MTLSMNRKLFISLAIAISILGSGCAHPLRVQTDTRVTFDNAIATSAKVTTDLPPVSDAGPVRFFAVDGKALAADETKIAIVDVDGLLVNAPLTGPYSLGENPVGQFREKLDAVACDTSVKAVVVRINSPGGAVTAADVMYRDLTAFRKRTGRPVVACLMDLGTGGGYLVATAADRIVAHPTTVTGGIGVILNLYNLRDAMAYFNVLSQPIRSGANIDMGSPIAPLSPEAKKLLQEICGEFHERFRSVVLSRRPAVDANRADLFDGRVLTAAKAKEANLIDEIGYLEDAALDAAGLAKIESPRLVIAHRENDPARSIYAQSPNTPLQSTPFPLSIPGLDRSRLPTFLYLWQPEATLEKLGGR